MAGAHQHIIKGERFGNSGGKIFRHANTPVHHGRDKHLAMRCGIRVTKCAKPEPFDVGAHPYTQAGQKGKRLLRKKAGNPNLARHQPPLMTQIATLNRRFRIGEQRHVARCLEIRLVEAGSTSDG